jgi:uncharacterized protein YbjT (DUF2867 family)
MNVVLFGATGMVGQGVLRECLLDPEVQRVLVIGRTPMEHRHAKLHEIVLADFLDYSGIEGELAGFDACFFCLGVSSLRMSEAKYRHITYDFTMAAARVLVRLNPGMTFIYVSGSGTNSNSRTMWARVKGETENALQKLPFRTVYLFRPGVIVPLHGIQSKTKLYRTAYAALGWLLPALRRTFPNQITTTEQIGRAMLRAARTGTPNTILENRQINSL